MKNYYLLKKAAMNLTCFVMFLTLFYGISCATNVEGQSIRNVHVTVQMQNAQIKKVMDEIKDQTDYHFFYDDEVINVVKKKISLDQKDKTVYEVLEEVANKTNLSFRQVNKTIAVKKSEYDEPELTENVIQQPTINVEGKVSDSRTGEPLAGVSIVVAGTVIGTATNADGSFQIQVPEQSERLIFSFVGYGQTEVDWNGKSYLEVKLEEQMDLVEEVVVVGYGTQKKINLTGAVSQISAETLEDRPLPNMTQLLQGAIPNLNIQFDSGRPGQEATVNVRGNTSINGGSPLVLIDGIPGSIDRVNPRDVESVSVLKDAAASAIYGARGAFGVILITTKTDNKGDLNISYGNNFGSSTPTVKTDFITTGYDWAKLVDEAFIRRTGNSYTEYTEDDYAELEKRRYDETENPERPWVVIDNRNGKDQYVYYGNFDWYNFLFSQWQPSQEHNISMSGGDDKLNFHLSGRYYEKDGIMNIKQDKFDFYTFRSKINAKVNDWLTVSNNTQFNKKSYSYYGLEGGYEQGDESNFAILAQHGSASYVPFNPDGSLTGRTGLNSYWVTAWGLAGNLIDGKSKGEEKSYEFTTTMEAIIKLSKSINIIGNYSYNLYTTQNYFRSVPSEYSLYPGVFELAKANSIDQLTEKSGLNQYYVANIYGNFQQSFGAHNVKLMIGYNQENKWIKSNTETKNNLTSQDLNAFDLATGDMTVNGSLSEWAIMGLFSRFGYDYKGKYLFEMNGRYDGTSRFPKGDRFGFFPSFSAGWRISEENFFSPLSSIFDNMKIRGSYGALGNQQVGTYAYISSMGTGTLNYIINGAQTQYTTVPDPVSASLTWEQTSTTNMGIDFDLFDSRLSTSFDWYIRKTTDMLTKGRTLPAVFGATEPKENAADLKTKGFEVSFKWSDKFDLGIDPFSYSISFVLSDYTAKITKYDNPSNLLSDYYVGQELGEMWGYMIDGYFASDEEAAAYDVNLTKVTNVHQFSGEWSEQRAGDLKYLDLNNDGIVNSGQNTLDDHGDMVRIGNSQPRYSFGMNMGANWKGFDLTVFLQGIGKQNWYPGRFSDLFWGPYSRPYMTFIPSDIQDKIWSPENPDAYFPLLRGYSAANTNAGLSTFNNRYLQDLAYIRVKNLTFGYSLPSSLLEKIRVKRCRIYMSCENLFTLTKLESKYVDPELVKNNLDTRNYPISKTFSAGLDITF